MKRGFFIGRTTLDILYYMEELPAENKKAKTLDYRTCVGGNACNAAITYAILGGKAVLITAIGNSNIGKSIKMELKEYDIEVLDLLEGRDILPFLSAILINTATESRTVWGGHQPPYIGAEMDEKNILRDAAFILTDNQFPQLSVPLLKKAQRAQIASVFDAERWGEETEILFGAATDVIASADCVSPDKSPLLEIMKEKGVLRRAVTDGGNPIVWEEEEHRGFIQPIHIIPVDTLGAGDIMHGAYCYFRFDKGLSFEKALEKAGQVSSFSVAYRGPRQGVLEYISKNEG